MNKQELPPPPIAEIAAGTAKISAINPGGQVIIHCFARTEPPDEFSALYSLRFFLYSGTRNYSFQEITTWLTEAGFSDFNRIDLPPTGQTSIVTGMKNS